MVNNEVVYADMLNRLKKQPLLPNGTREILNASMIFEPTTSLSVAKESYIRAELDWYLSMDRNIKGHPVIETNPIWQNCAAPDGSVNSNYGWCIYSEENHDQYKHAVMNLLKDPWTRQSVCTYIRPEIQVEHNDDIHAHYDFICTFCTHHFIRDDKLEYIVYMRSNDIEYGTPYDLAWHQRVYVKMYMELCEAGVLSETRIFKNLALGSIHWHASSLHLYEKRSKH